MEIYFFILRIMDGWSRATTKLKKLLMRITAHIGRTHRQSRKMHSIVIIEKLKLRSDGHLDVTAILENEARHKRGTFLFSSPDYAPIRAKTTIPSEALPPGETFGGKSIPDLTAMLDRHQLFLHQEWKPVKEEEQQEPKKDDFPGGRLFF